MPVWCTQVSACGPSDPHRGSRGEESGRFCGRRMGRGDSHDEHTQRASLWPQPGPTHALHAHGCLD
eukprot:1191061-Prymnesium_polylepis.2